MLDKEYREDGDAESLDPPVTGYGKVLVKLSPSLLSPLGAWERCGQSVQSRDGKKQKKWTKSTKIKF
jgi:hypothetical protein